MITVKVIFRQFQGETIALFPALASTCGHPECCESYARIGQHAAATYSLVIRGSRPATKSEANTLARELHRIGYSLKFVKRSSRADYLARVAQLQRTP